MSCQPRRRTSASTSPLFCSRSRSFCVGSPVTTMRDPSPSRVRNIFIWLTVVFCASSRIAKAWLSVRPRM